GRQAGYGDGVGPEVRRVRKSLEGRRLDGILYRLAAEEAPGRADVNEAPHPRRFGRREHLLRAGDVVALVCGVAATLAEPPRGVDDHLAPAQLPSQRSG